MSKAARGYQKNNYDIWVSCDASPHMDGEYYRTWFYFSVTGIPAGELVTFTFKNLSNQVSETIHLFCSNPITLTPYVFVSIIKIDKVIQLGLKTIVSSYANALEEVAKNYD